MRYRPLHRPISSLELSEVMSASKKNRLSNEHITIISRGYIWTPNSHPLTLQLSCGRTHENRDILNTSIRRLYNVHASFFARTLAHVQNTQHSSSLCLIKLPYDHTWYIGGDGSIPHELECLYHYAQFVDASSLLVSRQHHNNLTHY